MNKANKADIKSEGSEKRELGKISPDRIAGDPSELDEDKSNEIATEKSIIEAVRLFLRHYGKRKSG